MKLVELIAVVNKKRKSLTEIERLRRGIGCAKGSELKLIPNEI